MPLTVHFKRPADWRTTINIHYWDTTPAVPATTWPGVAMTAEGNDWFGYRFETAEAASIVFNDDAGRQTGNLGRDRSGWYYRNNTWYDLNPERPAIPVIRANPRARLYNTAQTVTLESENSDDAIYYTTDGSLPTRDGRTPSPGALRYSGPIAISQTTTLTTFGINSAGEAGQVRTFVYTIDPNADLEQPVLSANVNNGSFTVPVEVIFTVTDNRPAPVSVYLTTNGSEPTTASPV